MGYARVDVITRMLVVGLSLISGTTLRAQDAVPSSWLGTWILDVPRSTIGRPLAAPSGLTIIGQTLSLDQTAQQLRLSGETNYSDASGTHSARETNALNLDGTPSVVGPISFVFKRIDGSTFEINSELLVANRRLSETSHFVIAADGQTLTETKTQIERSADSNSNADATTRTSTSVLVFHKRIAAASAQAAAPEFEVASIHACDPDHLPEAPDGARGGGANSLQITRGRLRALCVTVATLIRTAYGYVPWELEFLAGGDRGQTREPIFGNVAGLGVEDGRRVRGGPDWIRSEHYTIEAVAADGQTPSAPMMRGPMLQRLLERRFQFTGHVDVEQTPTFALTVAKGGLKIKPVTGIADACEPMPPPTSTTRRRRLADVRRGEKPNCAFMGEREGPNMVFVGGAATLNTLATFLGGQLGGMSVLDRRPHGQIQLHSGVCDRRERRRCGRA